MIVLYELNDLTVDGNWLSGQNLNQGPSACPLRSFCNLVLCLVWEESCNADRDLKQKPMFWCAGAFQDDKRRLITVSAKGLGEDSGA